MTDAATQFRVKPLVYSRSILITAAKIAGKNTDSATALLTAPKRGGTEKIMSVIYTTTGNNFMEIIIPENPPPTYRLNAVQFFVGLGILLLGLYIMIEKNFDGGIVGIGLIIIGGIIGLLARKAPPGWKG